jgi:hypothetical protein
LVQPSSLRKRVQHPIVAARGHDTCTCVTML